MVSQFLEQSIPIDDVPCLPAFQLTEQRLCGGHVVSASLQHCDLLPSSASVQENCSVGLGASARACPGCLYRKLDSAISVVKAAEDGL
jgi:hypothetical protein